MSEREPKHQVNETTAEYAVTPDDAREKADDINSIPLGKSADVDEAWDEMLESMDDVFHRLAK